MGAMPVSIRPVFVLDFTMTATIAATDVVRMAFTAASSTLVARDGCGSFRKPPRVRLQASPRH